MNMFIQDSADLDFDFARLFDVEFSALVGTGDHVPRTIEEPQDEPGAAPESAVSMRARFEAFKRSQWMWNPVSGQSAFSELSGRFHIAIHKDTIDMPTSTACEPLPLDVQLPDTLSASARDRILQFAVESAPTHISIAHFPAVEVLDRLIKTAITTRMSTDAWLHLGTFSYENTKPHLLAALVAAGCACFADASINKTGLMIQELVRISLERLFEADNSVVRDLQYLQAYFIWVDMGFYSGYIRKMEIAESRFQPLCTALRRAGAFNGTLYHSVRIPPGCNEDELTGVWHRWVEQESFKR
ncbi:hypothetical protein SEUCBS139899_007615 [Sporothrix eucalyptigena]